MKKKILLALALVFVFSILAVSASAAVTVKYSLEEASTPAGAYKIVATVTDTDGDFRGFKNTISFDYGIIKPVSKTTGNAANIAGGTVKTPIQVAKYYDEDNEEYADVSYATGSPKWTVDGSKATLDVETFTTTFLDASKGLVAFEMYFKFADGKSIDDLVEGSFNVDYVAYANGTSHYYGNEDSSKNDLADAVSNNVVVIIETPTITVTTGDVIYLTDGTVAVADADGDYEVSGEGIIVVNTDTTAQKVYEVKDGAVTEVKALENAVLSSMAASIRGYGGINAAAKNKPGIRFLADFAKALKENSDVEEYGFMVTVDSEYNDLPDEYVLNSALVDTGKAIASAVYDSENDIYNYEEGDRTIVTVAFYGMPLTEANVLTDITARPYVKLTNGAIIYGEPATRQTYEVAWGVKNAGGEAYTKAKDYIDAILALVQETEKDVVIDVGPLF